MRVRDGVPVVGSDRLQVAPAHSFAEQNAECNEAAPPIHPCSAFCFALLRCLLLLHYGSFVRNQAEESSRVG